jgi:D-alanyl-D-alanine dipeptidase
MNGKTVVRRLRGRFVLALVTALAGSGAWALPDNFVFVDDAVPGIQVDLRYTGSNNFLGRPVRGYDQAKAVLSAPAAAALARVLGELKTFGLGLHIFDAYRPQRAVNDFVHWANDLNDNRMKPQYYPNVQKQNLFKEDYIAERSGHSRGSTVDLTLVALDSGQLLDMGSGFDFFGVESWPDFPGITAQQRANRLLLRSVMLKHGFKPYPKEWWHFTLENEPFPDTYFDFLPR